MSPLIASIDRLAIDSVFYLCHRQLSLYTHVHIANLRANVISSQLASVVAMYFFGKWQQPVYIELGNVMVMGIKTF